MSAAEKLVQKLVGVQDAAKVRGAAPREQRDALGVRAGRRTVSPHHPSAVCGETAGGGADGGDVVRSSGSGLWERPETVRSPPRTVRGRTTQRLLGGHGHPGEQFWARGLS
jgi:hypothetical protein